MQGDSRGYGAYLGTVPDYSAMEATERRREARRRPRRRPRRRRPASTAATARRDGRHAHREPLRHDVRAAGPQAGRDGRRGGAARRRSASRCAPLGERGVAPARARPAVAAPAATSVRAATAHVEAPPRRQPAIDPSMRAARHRLRDRAGSPTPLRRARSTSRTSASSRSAARTPRRTSARTGRSSSTSRHRRARRLRPAVRHRPGDRRDEAGLERQGTHDVRLLLLARRATASSTPRPRRPTRPARRRPTAVAGLRLGRLPDVRPLRGDAGRLGRRSASPTAPGYDAEATWCHQGGKIVFTSVRDGDLDLYEMDEDGGNVQRLTSAPGYDGGAFYNADCTEIVWRAAALRGRGARPSTARCSARGLRAPVEDGALRRRTPTAPTREQITQQRRGELRPYFTRTASGSSTRRTSSTRAAASSTS